MKKTVITMILASTMALNTVSVFATGITAQRIKYMDINGHWAEAAMNKYAGTNIFSVKDGKVFPDKTITRMEFVQMLHQALDIKIKYFKAPDIKEFYSDVINEDAGAMALYDLVVSDTIDAKGVFKPHQELPRDEMVHYIINALKNVTGGNYALIKMMPAPFDDDDKITSIYKNDIVEAVLLKIVNGKNGNMFYPLNGSTRAEAAVVIERLMTVLEKLNAEVVVKPSAEIKENSLELKLTITNLSKEPVVIQHTSGQKYDFALLDADRNVIYRWSADKLFLMAETTTLIEAEKTVEFTETLNEELYAGIKDHLKYMTAYIVGDSDSFKNNSLGYELIIQ
ncbi:MAG: BsuPI-related putative proteinase inhibitor [Clostridia bacterium]|nr:BsuPI-related putative proteinase inhibitor [Clostridia bacterium]